MYSSLIFHIYHSFYAHWRMPDFGVASDVEVQLHFGPSMASLTAWTNLGGEITQTSVSSIIGYVHCPRLEDGCSL